MKNIVSAILLFIGIVITGESFAQYLGVNAGLNFSKIHFNEDIYNYSSFKYNPGFNAGLTVEFPVQKVFSIETGLSFSSRGYRLKDKLVINNMTEKNVGRFNVDYLDIPLMSKINIKIRNTKFFGSFGPYIGIGLLAYGKEITTLNNKVTEKIINYVEFGSYLKRLDFGLCFAVGVELKSFQISLNHGLGLANIAPPNDDNDKVMHRVWGLSVGYKFIKKQ